MRIAFSGKLGVGKDFAADYLIRTHGGTKHSFASAIYDILTYAQTRCKLSLEKDRAFLQSVGDWAKSKEPNVWIDATLEEIPAVGNCFISDVRFPNELAALKRENWYCVRIRRVYPEEDRAGTGSVKHISETALDDVPDSDWDYIIENNGDIKSFEEKLGVMVNHFNQKYIYTGTSTSSQGSQPCGVSGASKRLGSESSFV